MNPNIPAMKRFQLSALMSFFLIFFISFTSFAKKEEMKLRLFKGEHYTYVISQENTMQENPKEILLSQTMALKIDHKVIDRQVNGNYLIEASFKSLSIEIKYNGTIQRYHSDTVNVANKLYKTLNFLTDIKLTYEVSPEGVVSKLSGFEPIKKKIETDPKLASLLRSFGNEHFLMEMYNYIPVQNVGVGDKWTGAAVMPDLMDFKYDIHYIFKEATVQNLKLDHQATINFSTEMPEAEGKTELVKETGTQKGILLIDPNSHMRLSSDIDQQMEIIGPSQRKPGGEKIIPLKLTNRTKMLLVKK